jgi:hypothetical protein
MSEAQIEARAEKMMDSLDREYLGSAMSWDSYRARIKAIDDWVWMQNYARRCARDYA